MVRNTIQCANVSLDASDLAGGTGLADELAAIGYPQAGPCAWMTDDERCELAAIELAEIEIDRCCQAADDYRAAEMRDALRWAAEMLGCVLVTVSRIEAMKSDGRASTSYVASVLDPVYASACGQTPRQAVAALVREMGFGGGQTARAAVVA